MNANGKGSKTRPRQITREQWEKNHDNIDWSDDEKPTRKEPKKRPTK